MKQLADDVFVLEGFPPHAINAYVLGDVLVDAATRFAAGRLLSPATRAKALVARDHSCASGPSGFESCDMRAAGAATLVRSD